MREFKGTKGKWFTYHNMLANPAGWVIKANDNVQTPIGVIHEPQGGKKNEDGVSPTQKSNAHLIAASPELLQFALDMVERYPNSPWILEQANKAIDKALGKESTHE